MAGAAQKKVVMVIAASKFRDEELVTPQAILQKAGCAVTLASSSLKPATGMLGGIAKANVLLKDVRAEDCDALVFVGGSGSAEYWNDPVAHALAKKTVAAGKIVAAICIAPVTLANAGLLSGRRATVWASEGGRLQARGATYTAKPVEVDGKLITADGPGSAEAFGNAIVTALGLR